MHHRHLIERELYQSDAYITEVVERLLLYEIEASEESEDEEKNQVDNTNMSPFDIKSPLNLHIQFL